MLLIIAGDIPFTSFDGNPLLWIVPVILTIVHFVLTICMINGPRFRLVARSDGEPRLGTALLINLMLFCTGLVGMLSKLAVSEPCYGFLALTVVCFLLFFIIGDAMDDRQTGVKHLSTEND